MKVLLTNNDTAESKIIEIADDNISYKYMMHIFVEEFNLDPEQIDIDSYYPYAWLALDKDTFECIAAMENIKYIPPEELKPISV